MSLADEIKVQCTKCGGMFAIVDEICSEAICRGCHGTDEAFRACAAKFQRKSVDEVLGEASAEDLDELASLLGAMKKKPSGVLARLNAERQRKKGKKGQKDGGKLPKMVRADSGDPAVTPERVVDATTRMRAAVETMGPTLCPRLLEGQRKFGEQCMAVMAEMPDGNFRGDVMTMSSARSNSALVETFPRVREDPPIGTTWLALVLKEGARSVVVFNLSASGQ